MLSRFSKHGRLVALLLLLLAVGLAFYGQFRLMELADLTLEVVVYFGLAAGFLVAAEWLARPGEQPVQPPADQQPTVASTPEAAPASTPEAAPALTTNLKPPQPAEIAAAGPKASFLVRGNLLRWLLTGAALALTGYVFWALGQGVVREHASFGPLVPWLSACVLMLLAWASVPSLAGLRAWFLAYRRELLIVAGLTLVAGMIRFWDLGGTPFTVSGDEGTMGIEMRRVLRGELRNPFILVPLSSISYIAEAVPSLLFGLSVWSQRLPHALMGTLSVPAVYLLARLLFNRQVALVAAIILAGYVLNVHYSRVAIKVIYDSFFYSVTLAALVYGLKYRAGPWPFVLAGMLAGLTQHANVGARLLPVVIVAFILYLLLFARHWLRGQWRNLLLMLLAFVVMVPSLIYYIIENPQIYNSRLNQVGIFQSGWVQREFDENQRSLVDIVFTQFERAVFGFVFHQDASVSYGGSALANPLLSLLLFTGMGLGLFHWWRHPWFALLLLWFWGGLISGNMLTFDPVPPASHRLLMLTPVVAILAAVALVELGRFVVAALALPDARRWLQRGVVGVAALIALLDVRFYFASYAPTHFFGGPHAYIATTLGYELSEQVPRPHMYFFGPPHMWSWFSTLGLLAPEVTRTDMETPLDSVDELEDALQSPDKDALFVILPHRIDELALLRERFPNGEMVEVIAPQNIHWVEDGSVLFTVYRVPRDQLAKPPPAASSPNENATAPEAPGW